MQDIFHFSESWRDPLPSLARAFLLLITVLAIESLVLLLKTDLIPISPIYFLGLLRAMEAFVLFFWGPWTLKEVHQWQALKESITITFSLVLFGLFFLIFWKKVFGIPFFKINPDFFYNSRPTLIVFYLTACLLSPVVEELIFRGILYRKIRDKMNILFSVSVVSLLFAAVHFFVNSPKLTALLVPFLGSLIFSIGYEKTKSIMTPILLHIFGNLVIFSTPFISFI